MTLSNGVSVFCVCACACACVCVSTFNTHIVMSTLKGASNLCFILLAALLVHLCCWSQPALAGGKKGDTIVLGGGKGGGHGGGGYGHGGGGGGGCGPIILKTGKKGKGNTIIMSGCKKKTYHKPTYEYKTYHHFMPEYGGHGGYGGGGGGGGGYGGHGGYDHGSSYGGHEEYGGYDDHGGYRK